MKVWIEKKQRASGKKYIVFVQNDDGKKQVKASFDINQKRQANIFADELRSTEPHLAMPAKVSFDMAFAAYKESVLKNELICYETRLGICGKINNHIQPYISKKLLSDYTLYDFNNSYIPALISSKSLLVINVSETKTITKRSLIQ